MNYGDIFTVTNGSNLDGEFEGRCGVFIRYTSKGYALVNLFGDADGTERRLHPESLTESKSESFV